MWVGYLYFPIFPVPRRTHKATAGERGGEAAPREGGLQGHHRGSLPVTSSAPAGCPTPRPFGDPREGAAPLPSPCPSAGLAGTLRRAAARGGYHSVQFCIIKLPWLFLLETFTILCLAGKDDCSKPKLGINYTTTLHFSYKGKLCGESCESTSFRCPPSQAHRGRPPTSQMSRLVFFLKKKKEKQQTNTKTTPKRPSPSLGTALPPGHAPSLAPRVPHRRERKERQLQERTPTAEKKLQKSCICAVGR